MNNIVKEKILAYIGSRDSKYATLDKLKANIKDEELESTLSKLVQTGEIILNKKKYKINNDPKYQGKVLVNRYGVKFIRSDNGKHIPINYGSFYSVLESDYVEYYVINEEAYICNIVRREISERPFKVITINHSLYLEYASGNFWIRAKDYDLSMYEPGDVLLVDLDNHKIVRKITTVSDPGSRDIILAYNHGFDNYYSEKYLEELNNLRFNITPEDLIGREDFRDDLIYTTDCDKTRDIDDATGVRRLPNGNYLFTGHIASTSEIIPFMGEICKTAFKRGTSAYTQRSVFHMYHPLISNGICSLNPNEDRLTQSIVMEIDKEGNVIQARLCYGVINSKKKMMYSEVDKLLSGDSSVDPTYLPYYDNLVLFKELTDIMGKYLVSHGKLELANRDVVIEYNNLDEATRCLPLEGPISRKMIEYAMIYINWQWTKILVENNIPLIYRNHLYPSKKDLANIINNLNNLGYNIQSSDSPQVIQTFLSSIKDDPVDFLIVTQVILNNLNSAGFDNVSKGHFGLGFKDYYAYFSSAIRRLADTFNHYATDAYLKNDMALREKLESIAKDVANWATTRENEATLLEKESLSYDLLDIAAKNLGNSYEGVVVDIKYNRVFVKLSNGLYGIIPDKYSLSIGDKIITRINGINEFKKEIYLEFISMQVKHKKRTRKKENF